MIDRIKFMLGRVKLLPAVISNTFKDPIFTRNYRSPSKLALDGTKTPTMYFDLKFEKQCIVRVIAFCAVDRSWWARSIEANLPALLRGHNGRQLASASDLHLALTLLRDFVSRLTTDESFGNILPGVNPNNPSYIASIEAFVQFDDPRSTFLKASHTARINHQHKPVGVFFGESSACYTSALKIQVYDKDRQLRFGQPEVPGSTPVRLEAAFRNASALAQATASAVRDYPASFFGAPGPLVATLSPETALALVRGAFDRMSGFGWAPAPESIKDLSTTSRLLIAGAGKALLDPHGPERVISNYVAAENPGQKTARKVGKEIRAWAIRQRLEAAGQWPPRIFELPPAPVCWPAREVAWASLLQHVGAPTEAAEDIVNAWSLTQFLKVKPTDRDMVGNIAPGPPPFTRPTAAAQGSGEWRTERAQADH